MGFQMAGLNDGALDLEPTGGRVGLGRRGANFGRLDPPARAVERVPAEPERLDQQDEGDNGGDSRNHPGDRLQRRRMGRRHGNIFRSSSKCGPSRSFGQSPPQTIAVPCRTAAALKAAAMRG